MFDIQNGIHPPSTLCELEPKVLQRNWYKSCYEEVFDELLDMTPHRAESILSVGCGWGASEAELQERGARVTALVLDSVIGAVAAGRGIETIYGTMEEGLQILEGRSFDCVLMTNLLHLLPDPWRLLESYSRLLGKGGTLVIAGPNFEFFPHLAKRVLGLGDYRKLRDFSQSGLHACGIKTVHRQIERAGFRVASSRWFNLAQPRRMLMLHRWPKRLIARSWIMRAQR
jgi:SAM-dependent methyltransferase